MATFQKIIPNLWFDKNAEEAVAFYLSVFKNGRITRTAYYGKAGHEIHGMHDGSIMTIEYELDGQKFIALNGGPVFHFTEAVSFVIDCKDQEEIDYYWEKLTAGGDPASQQCGWLKDKFGLSWQVVPMELSDMMLDPDKEKAGRAMEAMMKMKKIVIAELDAAYRG